MNGACVIFSFLKHICVVYRYLDTMPNTYVFSKKLAEQVISDYSETLPCVLIRPSIVIATLNEPMKGWIDNFNGPVGMLVAGGKGLVRVLLSDPFCNSDFIPVDGAIKFMVVAAWLRAIKT